MSRYKKLNIRGSLLDKNQLIKHIEVVASEHIVNNKSSKNTYPIKNLIDDYKFIINTYNLLMKHVKLGIKIHSAGEWILDNFYIIEENVKIIEKELSMKKYLKLPGLANEEFLGFARVYVLAEEIVAYSNCMIDSEVIDISLRGYQKKKALNIEELNMLGIFLKISLIKHIRMLCERIYFSQIQKHKVEDIIERIIERKEVKNQLFYIKNPIKIGDEALRYPFIEYMSYRLKKYGKSAIKYKEILEKEVQKTGFSVDEVIQKEHFDIANIKVTIGNSILSIKEISRIDFIENYSYMNAFEEILRKDPASVYIKMDEESKALYRREIEKIVKKYKLSEIYIAEKILELANLYSQEDNKDDRRLHVGYYLLTKEGKRELFDKLEIKINKQLSEKLYSKLYVFFTSINPLIMCLILLKILNNYYNLFLVNIVISILFYLPFSEINIRIINYFLSKFIKPKILPKIDFKSGISEDAKTFIVVPCILKSKEKVEELFKKLEVYYLANKSDNLYFALLGDCSEEKCKVKEFDEEVIFSGQEIVKKLNKKYSDAKFEKFHFLYRERLWNECEKSFIGWERKRGYLELFNKYIKKKINNPFFINTIEKSRDKIPEIKYVITLDSDTNLCLGSASKLIGAMEHTLNRPIIENGKVISGYGIMQPRIGMDLAYTKKTCFIDLFSLKGGVDFYTNAISDIYQDCFGEGIFTGKGIYNVDVYNQILNGEIPENTVLSHDLLEGNLLRCGLLTDVLLLDGFPLRYIPYILRNHRWNRGDWQIIKWLKSDKLNLISKFKIFDNLRRSLVPIFIFIIILLCSLGWINNFIISSFYIGIAVLSLVIPFVLDIINYVVFKESLVAGTEYAYKKFSKELNLPCAWGIRILLTLMFLPYEMYMNLDSMVRSLYRMKTKTKLLEWMTAEDGENKIKNDLKTYIKNMKINLIIGIIFLIFGNVLGKIFGLLFIVGIFVAFLISKDNKEKVEVNEENRRFLDSIARKTWDYFEDYIIEENNYLIPDNYQENRLKKVVDRTSSTNIGLELISVISAYDLGYISFKKTMDYLNKILIVVSSLSKWNGHLYNWYNIKTLMPLMPRYISTVDSGNFVGYLYIVKSFLNENKYRGNFEYLIEIVDKLIQETDFMKLYNEKIKLFSIGFNLEENKLTDSYYDFLASEARQASLVAIAKNDVPIKHWNNLSRTLTSLNGYKGLISWTGTAFEYLMPNINLNRYKGSLIDESSQFLIMSQIEYAKKRKTPWGISESAFNLKDLYNNYQYKAFGIPWLGLKRGLEKDLVISPYSTFLSLEYVSEKAIDNLKRLEKIGMVGKYGFYESIDYTPGRKQMGNPVIVKTYMAHHQALSFLSVNNLLNSNILRKRFNNNPEIEAVDILLQERMPAQMILTKEKKEKVEKNEHFVEGVYVEKNFDTSTQEINVLSNENYKITVFDNGNSISEFDDYMVNSYKNTKDIPQRINSYVKNIKTRKIINVKDKAKVMFSQDKVKFIKNENNLRINEIIMLDPNRSVEIRRLEIENLGNQDEVLETIFDMEPSFSRKMEEYSHPAFNKLFMKIYKNNDNLIFEKRDRNLVENKYIVMSLYTENEQVVDFEYEIDREKYYGRENLEIPEKIKNQISFSSEIKDLTDPIIAMKRTIKIKAKGKISVNFIISVSKDRDEAINNLEKIKSEEEIVRLLNVVRLRSEEEAKYLQVNSEKISRFMSFYKYLLSNKAKDKNALNDMSIDSLWKYGVSGDNPIVLVKIKSIEDIYVVKEVLELYEYYRAKKVFFDLIIINDERNLNDLYVLNGIEEAIANKQLEYMKNKKAGIFIFNKKEINNIDFSVFEYKANIIVDASINNLETYLNELKSKELSKIKEENINLALTGEVYPLKVETLEFDNSFGGFKENGKEYLIYKKDDNRLPSVWCNVLANKHFGTLITDNLGGYTWSKNCRMNRITAWNNDKVYDLPSEIIYIKDEDSKEFWTINSGVRPNKNYYYITHGYGYSKIKNINKDLLQEVEVFVPSQEESKVWKFRINNLINEKRNLKILMYIKPVLGEDEYLSNGDIYLNRDSNVIKVNNVFRDSNFKDKEVYITSDLNINSFTGDKDFFFGNGDLTRPDVINKRLDNKNGLNKNSAIGIEFVFKLNGLECKEFYIELGVSKLNEIIEDKELSSVKNALENTKQFWNNYTEIIQIKTPERSLDILMNGWLVYQTIASRIYAKTGFYQSGGAIGFRDQLQDAIGMKYIDSNLLKEQILVAARHQFIEGDVLHWWHDETKKGVRTKFSDDFLWLVYAVLEYITVVNSDEILFENVEYLKGDILKEDEYEKYNVFYSGNVEESIFKHCERAINNCISKGLDPFPKIGIGDWNDGFNNLGEKGKGESIWLGFFLYDILNKFIPVCERMNRKDLVYKYSEIKDKLKKDLNTEGWDGRWFKRAISDSGEVIGSINSEECRIDSLSQSWSVISGAADNDKKYIAMNELENYLIDKENKIIKLFDPPFEKTKINPGYIKSYLPGIRENGGQYTHAACWVIMAETMLGFGDKALEIAQMINPIEHSKTREDAKRFKLEPYVIEADLYSNKDMIGQGGWNWYTGSSGWYYRAVLENILGFKIENGYLKIEPCIPKEWKEYEIIYKYKSSMYKIKVFNKNNKNQGVETIILNGKKQLEKRILLEDNFKTNCIEIFL